MNILARSLLLCVAAMFTVYGITSQDCNKKAICETYGGHCIATADRDDCNGTVYNKGCSPQGCSCCIGNTTICIAKPKCERYENSKCYKFENWTNCEGAIDSSGCHGEGCGCCMPGVCNNITEECKVNGGYCILQDSKHKCPGTVHNKGCIGDECACCLPDKSLCIAKPHCKNEGGNCTREFTTCDYEVDERGCHGDGCACCKTLNTCTRTSGCSDAGGYCFNPDENDCDGTPQDDGCDGDGCSCCIPA